jgi:hypothetical protein
VYTATRRNNRRPDDPAEATHSWVGSQIVAWGRFEAEEPDARFRVLAGSQYRTAVVNPAHAVFKGQQSVYEKQEALAAEHVLDEGNQVFLTDHVFPNWSRASYAVSGKSTYSGGYHWQRID